MQPSQLCQVNTVSPVITSEVEGKAYPSSLSSGTLTSRPNIKTLTQKTDTYLHILCRPKKSTLHKVSSKFILMLQNTNKTLKVKESFVEFLPFRDSSSLFHDLLGLSRSVKHTLLTNWYQHLNSSLH